MPKGKTAKTSKGKTAKQTGTGQKRTPRDNARGDVRDPKTLKRNEAKEARARADADAGTLPPSPQIDQAGMEQANPTADDDTRATNDPDRLADEKRAELIKSEEAQHGLLPTAELTLQNTAEQMDADKYPMIKRTDKTPEQVGVVEPDAEKVGKTLLDGKEVKKFTPEQLGIVEPTDKNAVGRTRVDGKEVGSSKR